jgi:aminoglycoside phosphotransferase family enzyme/predicted kinase
VIATQPTALSTALERALQRPGGPPVELRETHVSWVFLAGDRAYKLKKPVRFGFIDLRTAPARRAACEEEVRVNRVLAPDVVLGVRGLAPAGEGCVLVDAQAPDAIDWVVEMRRFDEGRTMAALLARDALPDGAPAAIAARVARFHAETGVHQELRHADAVHTEVRENLDELAGLERPTPRALVRIAGFVDGFVAARRAELDARGRAGMVRDGHGDLRAEHVVLEDGAVTIVDRLEFDPALRRVDVADDVAFLVMDLHALGAGDVAEELLDAYRAAGGDPGDDALVAFFAVHRALVRAKVTLLRARQRPAGSAEAAAEHAAAAALIALAERFAWRARGRRALLVHGPPASGKTWLASALAAASGFPVVSTDAARKELLGVAAGQAAPADAYTEAGRRRIYAEVGRRAAAALERGSVIVDATLGDPAVRGALLGTLAPEADRIVAIECRASQATLVRRAAARAGRPGELSDAGPADAERLARAFTPLDEVPQAQHLVVDAEQDVEDLVDRVAGWLDRAGP